MEASDTTKVSSKGLTAGRPHLPVCRRLSCNATVARLGGSEPYGQHSSRGSNIWDNVTARFNGCSSSGRPPENTWIPGRQHGDGNGAFGGGIATTLSSWYWPFSSLFGRRREKAVKKKKVLILMSDTGGGHRASAQALRAAFELKYGDKYQVDIVDMWTQHTQWPFNQVPRTYGFMVHHRALWWGSYHFFNPRAVHKPYLATVGCLVGSQVAAAYEHYRPDLVVSVHPLMQHIPLKVLNQLVRRGLQKPTKFATVVTDLTTCHNTWFHPGVTKCFVASEYTRQKAMRLGLKPSQIEMHGLPIRPSFSQKLPPKATLRKRLGLDQDKPAVLLVGGGEGMGPVEATVTALVEHVGAACQLVVVCGRNARLVQRLQAREYPEGMRVVIKGFVDDMPQWMSAVDAIITKAGPGTIAESLICGLPMVLNSYVPCQEEGNIPFVLDNRVGAFERDPVKISEIIRAWFGERRGELRAMAARARRLMHADAVFRIVEDLVGLIPEDEPEFEPALRPQVVLA